MKRISRGIEDIIGMIRTTVPPLTLRAGDYYTVHRVKVTSARVSCPL